MLGSFIPKLSQSAGFSRKKSFEVAGYILSYPLEIEK
jgi:hypothetical protein